MNWKFNFAAICSLTIGLTVALSAISIFAEPQMKPNVIEQHEFTVVGIAARTTNAKEATPDGVIGKQWDRFFKGGILEKIPNKADSNIVAVYTDYASDKDGEYTYVLGAKVNSAANVPAGMVSKKIPAGHYVIFTTDKGPGFQVVPKAWQRIWAIPKSEPGGNREYKADFEIYDQRAADPQNAQVDIYVRVK